jgi:hydrogenase small subunit
MATHEIPVLWIQGAGCTGCSVSVLNTKDPGIQNVVLDEVVPGQHVNIRFHPTISAGQGDPLMHVLEAAPKEIPKGYVLVVEGAIPTADGGTFCHVGEHDGKGIPFAQHVEALARSALAVIGLGDCGAFGGLPSCSPNPSGAMGCMDFFRTKNIPTPLVNVPGCPPHPDWFVKTVAGILLFGLPKREELDDWLRPKTFYGKLIHENCPRRPSFDAGVFAKKPGDPGCLFERGCKGPTTYADCPDRQWNGGTNWCIRAGAPCIGCTEPRFFDRWAPIYEKVTEKRLEGFKA